MADDSPPRLDARGVVVLTQEQAAKLARMGVVATEPPGSVRACGVTAHEATWYQRPWPFGDLYCDICHPSAETLRAEGYPNGRRNIGTEKFTGRHVGPAPAKWERATSDLSGQVDAKTTLFGDEG